MDTNTTFRSPHRRQARCWPPLLLLIAIFALASCTDSGDAANASGSGSPGVDCNLLSDEFVASVVGEGAVFKDASSNTDVAGTIATCEWRHPEGLDGPGDYYEIIVDVISPGEIDDSIKFVFTEPVDGLGDEGYRVSLGEEQRFHYYEIKVGDTAFRLNMISTFGFDRTNEGTLELAKEMLAEVVRNQN